MNKRLTLSDFTGFKKIISDEELLIRAERAASMGYIPSSMAINFILNYSKSLEIKNTKIGKAALLMN